MGNFMKMTKRLNSNVIGIVSGSDFKNGNLPIAYLGRAEDGKFLGFIQKYSNSKLMIYGENLEDFIFGKDDIYSVNVVASNIAFRTVSNKPARGTKYEVKFKNGKTAILSVHDTAQIFVDAVLY